MFTLVKDAVRKAEAAASLAAEDSVKRGGGHQAEGTVAAEEKVNKLAAEIEDNSSMKEGRAAKKVNLLMHHITHSRNTDDEGKLRHHFNTSFPGLEGQSRPGRKADYMEKTRDEEGLFVSSRKVHV